MKQLNLTTMCIVCVVLLGFFSSCSKNEEEPAVPPGSGGQTGTTDQGQLPWDGIYPSIDDAKQILQEALADENGLPNIQYNVVLISSAKHLAAMNVLITNNDTIKNSRGYMLPCAQLRYRLTTDIDLNRRAWTSIGGMDPNSGTNFEGDFDGQGHTIKNLNVYCDNENENAAPYAGLFRRVLPGTYDPSWGIRHLIVEGIVDVTAQNKCYAGGIAAVSNGGNIKFCRFNGTININLRSQSNRNYFYVGGIVGHTQNYTSVTNCISDISIYCKTSNSSKSIYKGGLIGYVNDNTILSNSAWMNVSETKAIGYIQSSSSVQSTANNGFADIPALNELLSGMNIDDSKNTYKWQANPNTQGYPLLVKKE